MRTVKARPPPSAAASSNCLTSYGQTVRYNGRLTDKPTRLGSDDDTFRLVGDLKGDLAGAGKGTLLEDWEWELFTTYGVSRYKATLSDNIKPELQAALNSCSNPADLSNCFNPFYSSRLGTGTPNSDAVLRRIQGESRSTTDSGLRTYNAGMNGSLFDLPGGRAGFALGGEIRHEWRHSDVDHDANLFDYGLCIGNTDYAAERNVYGGLDFYSCVQTQCSDVADDQAALATCVRSSCSAFFGGASTYMPLQPCIETDPCASICSASVRP